MTAPSLIHAARNAPDARDRILEMAHLMREHAHGPEGACTSVHLYVAGFTQAEVEVYRDDARAVLAGKPSALRTSRPGRLEGKALVKAAQVLRGAKTPPGWKAPVVTEIEPATWGRPSVHSDHTHRG